MKLKAILFDLDGTLLPMDNDVFTKGYFKLLAAKLDPYGYEPKQLIDGVWQGTKAMVMNNGKQTNEQVFWKEFASVFGDKVYSDIDKFNEFYTADKLLMQDVNITVRPGQKIAIVGPTGAGKTTLINLLMRFYEINYGEILVDGVNTKEMTRRELRNHFGMVLQDTWLFEGSIMENIAYSRDGLTEDEIVAASKAACADGFIRTMPGAYDMELSKGAENISQGERQLLTIARAMVSDPEIMILDEATSNVDTHTEQKIQLAMAQLMKGRTSFVIAHRLSTIKDADMILYMENGDIKEVGNHDELMKLNGKYAVLYNSQFA